MAQSRASALAKQTEIENSWVETGAEESVSALARWSAVSELGLVQGEHARLICNEVPLLQEQQLWIYISLQLPESTGQHEVRTFQNQDLWFLRK